MNGTYPYNFCHCSIHSALSNYLVCPDAVVYVLRTVGRDVLQMTDVPHGVRWKSFESNMSKN